VAPAAPLPRYGSSFLLDAVQSFRREEVTAGSPRDELRLYLESGTESTDNVIAWWGVSYFYYLMNMSDCSDFLASVNGKVSDVEAHGA
jgi:hypothetical protein